MALVRKTWSSRGNWDDAYSCWEDRIIYAHWLTFLVFCCLFVCLYSLCLVFMSVHCVKSACGSVCTNCLFGCGFMKMSMTLPKRIQADGFSFVASLFCGLIFMMFLTAAVPSHTSRIVLKPLRLLITTRFYPKTSSPGLHRKPVLCFYLHPPATVPLVLYPQ